MAPAAAVASLPVWACTPETSCSAPNEAWI
jgi:hypothetical protein